MNINYKLNPVKERKLMVLLKKTIFKKILSIYLIYDKKREEIKK